MKALLLVLLSATIAVGQVAKPAPTINAYQRPVTIDRIPGLRAKLDSIANLAKSPGAPVAGKDGITPTITVGTVTALASGSTPVVTRTGSTTAATFNFGFPAPAAPIPGNPGANGNTPTVSIGNTSTLAAGSTPVVTNTGSATAVVLSFGLPVPATPTNGKDGVSPSITIGTTTTVASGLPALVTNTGTTSAAILNFWIPTGPAGAPGISGVSSLSVSSTQTLPLIALGGTYSFTVSVPGATTNMAALINFPTAMLDLLTSYSANIESAGVVTVRLKAGLAIAAGSKTFVIKVIQ